MENKVKNKENTKRKMLDAVESIIKNEGFSGLGVNKVSRVSGVSKILIYRYFGNFEKLLKAYVVEKDFWTRYLTEDPKPEDADLSLKMQINKLLTEQFTNFYEHCQMEAMLVNEISNDNEFVKHMSRHISATDQTAYSGVVSTLLQAGTDHLILGMDGENVSEEELLSRKTELLQSIGKIVDWTCE